MNLDYKKIFTIKQGRIDCLVVGGLAINFHGIPRMTYDLDLMLLLEPDNILKSYKSASGATAPGRRSIPATWQMPPSGNPG